MTRNQKLGIFPIFCNNFSPLTPKLTIWWTFQLVLKKPNPNPPKTAKWVGAQFNRLRAENWKKNSSGHEIIKNIIKFTKTHVFGQFHIFSEIAPKIKSPQNRYSEAKNKTRNRKCWIFLIFCEIFSSLAPKLTISWTFQLVLKKNCAWELNPSSSEARTNYVR